ncbi:MAG: (2Fe-2S) ferredoxin domain-containing protein [Chloroflexota bacterium]
MKPIKGHILFCDGSDCKKKGNKKARKHMKKALKEAKQPFVRCSTTKCLGAYKQAPIMVVYPDGTWYSNATSKRDIQAIVEQHIVDDKPLEKNVLYQIPARK